jgi:hypothetical protein
MRSTFFQVPTEFIRKIVILLNKGSIHSSMTLSDDCSGSIGLREDFAKNCFETLLEFSLLDTDASEQDTSITNRLAITSLLQRFKEVRNHWSVTSMFQQDRSGFQDCGVLSPMKKFETVEKVS